MIPQARLQPSAPMSIARTFSRPASATLSDPVNVRTMISPKSTSETRSIGSSTRLEDLMASCGFIRWSSDALAVKEEPGKQAVRAFDPHLAARFENKPVRECMLHLLCDRSLLRQPSQPVGWAFSLSLLVLGVSPLPGGQVTVQLGNVFEHRHTWKGFHDLENFLNLRLHVNER